MRLIGFSLSLLVAAGGVTNGQAQGVTALGTQFVRDEAKLWTSPLRADRGDLKWLAPLGIGTAILLKTDRRISAELAESQGIQSPSHTVSKVGTWPLFVVPASTIAVGRLAGNTRAAHAGSVTLQAVVHSELIVQVLKTATNRERPDKSGTHGDFWAGGTSFPSGHAMSSWAFASAMADQYRDRRWVGVSAYAMASAVSVSRITGQNHYPSDAVVGATVGWLIGHYVSRHHR